MIHFDFKVDETDAENILDAIHWQAIYALSKASDINKTKSEREYYRKDYEYLLKLISLMKHSRVK